MNNKISYIFFIYKMNQTLVSNYKYYMIVDDKGET